MNNNFNIIISIAAVVVVVAASFAYLNSNPPLVATIGPPYLGVSVAIVDIAPQIAQDIGLSEPKGFLVKEILVNSPADRAGIKVGDTIVALDNMEFQGADDIFTYIRSEKQVGDTLKVIIIRDGSVQQIDAILEEAP